MKPAQVHSNQYINSVRLIKLTFTSILIFSFFYLVLSYQKRMESGGDPWSTGDWLINYEGGFVRRGLIGQIIFYIHDISGLGILKITFIFQLFFLACFFILYGFAYCISKQKIVVLCLFFSPTMLLFYPLNTFGSFRKEIIGFTILLFAVIASMQTSFRNTLLVIINVFYFIFVFSWEAGIVFLIPTMYLLYENIPEVKVKKSIQRYLFYLPAITSFFAFCLSLYFHGNRENIIGICSSLQNAELQSYICNGAIVTLDISFRDSLDNLLVLFKVYDYWIHIIILSLSFVVFLFITKVQKLFCIFLTVIPCLLLFVVGWDYGRWTNIMLTIFGILILVSPLTEKTKNDSKIWVAFGFMFYFSSFFWGMSHYGKVLIPGFYNLFIQ